MSEAGSRLSRMSYDGFAVPFLVSHGLLYHMDIRLKDLFGFEPEEAKIPQVSEGGIFL